MNSFYKRFLSMTLALAVVTSTMAICAQDANEIADENQVVVDTKAEAVTDEIVSTDEAVTDKAETTVDTSKETEDKSYIETEEERHEKDAQAIHTFTGRPITPVPDEMREPDAHGGKVLRFRNMDFSRPSKREDWIFSNNGANPPVSDMRFIDQGDGRGYHEYVVIDANRGQGLYQDTKTTSVPIKANRKYLFAALVWTDFTRINDGWTMEVNMGPRMWTELDELVLTSRHGLPSYTDGWKWQYFEFSPGQQQAAIQATMFLGFNRVPATGFPGNFGIADVCIIELPEVEPRKAYAEGEGVTFRGSAGAFDMRVEGATQTEDKIVVETTGTTYTFDLKKDTITSAQKITKQRDVSVWNVGTDLSTLKIKSTTEKECVITNPEVTFGVQMDGIMFMTPHKGNVSMKVTSQLSGLFNRYAYGHLTVVDGYGGFTVTPDISMGSGLLSDCQVLTPGLDFVDYAFQNQLFFDNATLEPFDMNHLVSNCKSGFQFNWNVRPGERLAVSTFPPREYDWEAAWRNRAKNSTFDALDTNWIASRDLDHIILWQYNDSGYANEYQLRHTFNANEGVLIKNIQAIRDNGATPVMYVSAYFGPQRQTPDGYINEVKRLKDAYGIEGIYSDGTPSEWKWVTAYEELRMLRELFHDGYIELHQTGVHENGGPPLSSPSYFIPGLDTYATATYKGEGIGIIGVNPGLLSLTWSQTNVANTIGWIKPDRWYPLLGKTGELVLVGYDDANMLALEWNVRGKETSSTRWQSEYLASLKELEALWREKGDDPDFYEKYYQPKARELIKPVAEKYGFYEEIDEKFDDELLAKEYAFYDTKHEITDAGDGNNALKIYGNGKGDGSMLKRFAPIGGPMTISYKFKVDERGNFEHAFSDVIGTRPMTLRFGKDGKISLGNSKGYYVNIGSYKKDEWIDVVVDIDTDKHTCDVTINGKKLVHSLRLPNNFYNVSEMEFFNGGMGAISYMDDLKVINKY